MEITTPSRRQSSSSTGPKKGLFVKNQWMCDCTPRLPATNLRVKKTSVNHGRWFWSCSKGTQDQSKGCGFFLWNDDAKPREIQSLFSQNTINPSSTSTPSRPLQQTKLTISSTQQMSLHKSPTSNRKENVNIAMGAQGVEYADGEEIDEIEDRDSQLPAAFRFQGGVRTQKPQLQQLRHHRQQSRDTDMAYTGNEDGSDALGEETGPDDSNFGGQPRKVQRSGMGDSPSKQLRMTATFANRQSFSSGGGGDGDQGMTGTTPSTRFQGLHVGTPASSRYAEYQERFDSATPVRKPNFGQFGKTPTSVGGGGGGRGLFGVKPSPLGEGDNPFASGTPRKRPDNGVFGGSSTGEITPSRTFQDKVIDAETEVFDILDAADVAMSKKTREQLTEVLQRIQKQSVGFMRARDMVREKNKELTQRHFREQEELDLARSNKESSKGLDKAMAATLTAQKKDIEELKLELSQVKTELSEKEEENDDLKEQLKKYDDL